MHREILYRDSNTDYLISFKRDHSMLTFETASVQGAKGIVEKLSVRIFPPCRNQNTFALSEGPIITNEKILQSLPFQKVKHQLATFDAQPSQDNAITVLLTGALLVCEDQEYFHRMVLPNLFFN